MTDSDVPDLTPCPSCGRGVSASFDKCLFCHEPLPDRLDVEPGAAARPAIPPPAPPGASQETSVFDPPAPRPLGGPLEPASPQPAATSRPARIGIAAIAVVAGLAVAGGLVVVGSASTDDQPGPSFDIVGTTIVTPPVTYGDGDRVALSELVVGECWTPPAEGFDEEGVFDVARVGCDEPHLGELYALVDHEFDDYPGDAPIIFDAQRRCLDALEEALDVDYESAPYDVYWIWPGAESWAAGDRVTQCSYTALDFSPLESAAVATAQPLPGTSVPVAAAESCEQLADYTLGVAEVFVQQLDSMTMSELEDLDPALPLPGTERYVKREAEIILRAYEIGCSLGALNELVVDQIGSIPPGSLASTAFLSSIRTDGYYDESLIP